MSQRERVLEMLEAAGPEGVTTAEFIQAFVSRFSARVEELRKAGHSISTQRISKGSFRYTLESSEPAPPSPVDEGSDSAKDGGQPATPPTPGVAGDLEEGVLFDVDIGPVSAVTGKVVDWREAA